MEVYLGKCRSEDVECGSCDFCFKELNNLQIHLNTCEIYECGDCYIRYQTLCELKKHITDEHEGSTKILQSKMDGNIINEVCTKPYNLSDL